MFYTIAYIIKKISYRGNCIRIKVRMSQGTGIIYSGRYQIRGDFLGYISEWQIKFGWYIVTTMMIMMMIIIIITIILFILWRTRL